MTHYPGNLEELVSCGNYTLSSTYLIVSFPVVKIHVRAWNG